jgi:Ca2+/H+ antiporter
MINKMITNASSAEASQADPGTPQAGALRQPSRPSPALWTGVYLGTLLNIVMIAALVAANRFPSLEPYALERNAASCGLFVLFLLIPVIRFARRPTQMFAAGFTGWVLFVAGYRLAGFYFPSLFQVLRTPFEALLEGCVLYGVAAVIFWVAGMIFEVRRHALAPRSHPVHPAVHHRS